MKRNLNVSVACLLAIAAVVAGMSQSAVAAPFTPGNLVVLTTTPVDPVTLCSGGAWPKPNTLLEYTTTGTLVQTIPIPTSGAIFAYGNGSSTASSQINFSDFDNQVIYIAATFVNSFPGDSCVAGMGTPGYVRYNAHTGTLDDGVAMLSNTTADGRGVVEYGCNALVSTNVIANGTYRIFNGVATQIITGNCRYLEFFNNLAYVDTGVSSGPFSSGRGVYTFDPTSTPPATLTYLFQTTATNPLGFAVADANTIYLTECFNPFTPNSATTGLYKFANVAGSWTNVGRLNSLANEVPSAEAMDVAAAVSGGSATLYVVGGGEGVGGNTIYKVGPDLLANADGPTWKATTTSSIVTGLSGARSIAIVPPTITPPTFTITTSVTPAGGGSVSRDLPGPNYSQCSIVHLTATANPGFNFTSWSGDATGSSNPLSVVTNGNKNITANFTPAAGNSLLTINFTGNGSVNANPPNTTYTNPPTSSQSNSYTNGTNITLTATPASGWIFDHWAPSNSTSTSLPINNIQVNTTVTAVFKQLFRVRVFVTGNGSATITSPTQDGTDGSGFPLFRDGTVITVQATPNAFPPISQPWTFFDWQDQNNNSLSSANPYSPAPILTNFDITAHFEETPANATARGFTAGNLVVSQVRDNTSSGGGEVDIREYTTAGVLVQPVIRMPNTGSPSGSIQSSSSGVGFQIAFDSANPRLLYAATNRVNGGTNTGFLRARFTSPSWAFDTGGSNGTFAFNDEGRGVIANGGDVMYGFADGLGHYNVCTAATSLIGSPNDNQRMLRFDPAGNLYCSTAGTSASGDFTGGPGIYRIDTPFGTPVYTQVLPLPGASPSDFCFADATHMYVGFNNSTAGPPRNVHRYFFDGSQWNDAAFGSDGIGSLLGQWGGGLDVKVVGTTATVYIMASDGPTNSTLFAATDDLTDPTGSGWFDQTPTVIVPMVTRGRGVRIAPTATCVLPGDLNGDGKKDGKDIRQYITCFISAAGCTTTAGCSCADVLGTGILDNNNLNAFVNLLIN